MDEHAGGACFLSVLIVAAFAILLHDGPHHAQPPAHPPTPEANNPTAARLNHDPAPTHNPPPAPPASVGSFRSSPTVSASQPKVAQVTTAARESSNTRPQPVAAPRPEFAPRSVVAPIREVAPPPARGAFTVVRAGETLPEIAARVYGSALAAEELWKANRDQLSDRDAPIPRGTLLRTP